MQFSTDRIHHATACRRAPLEKLIVAQPVKEFSAICWNRRFINLLSRAHQWSLFCTLWIQFTHSHPISLRTTFILSPIYVCVFQVVSFVHAFPPKGPDNVVGLAITLSGLDNQGFLFRFPSDTRDSSLLLSVQASSGAHPAIQEVQKALFRRVKRPKSESDHLLWYSTKVKNKWSYTSVLHKPLGCVQEHLYVYYSHRKPVCLTLLSHACHTLCPSHYPWSDIPVIFGAKHTSCSSLRRVFRPPTASSLITPDSLFSLLLSNAWFISSILSVRKLPHKATGTVVALHIYIFTFSGMRREDKSFKVNSNKHFAKLICS